MRTAIAVGDYHKPGETMINRHIAHLFDGNTCVVAGRYSGDNPYHKPVFERRAPLSLGDRLIAPYRMMRSRVTHATTRLPFGRRKQELEAFLRAQGVEVILAEFGTQALAVAPLAHEMGIPVFSYFRGTDASAALRTRHVVAAYRLCVPDLDGVFSVSRFLLDNLAAHGIHNDNAHVIPSGVDTDLFAPAAEKVPKTCVAVGRMVEKKSPLLTLRAFAAASAQEPEARLTMIGDGLLLDTARALAAELGVAARVRFPGALPHEDVRAEMARSEVFLQHSVTAANGNTEGMPIAIQEALASGCIVVSTRHAGIPEAVDEGVTGYLVDEGDIDAYGARIATALAIGAGHEMRAAARRAAVERFDNRRLVAQLEGLIADAVEKRRRTA